MRPQTGALLVALPLLIDPNFSRTVVGILHHDDEGTLGVILNRPTDVAVADVLPEWHGVCTSPSVAFYGGPVEPEVALAIGRGNGIPATIGPFGMVDLDVPGEGVSEVRIFAGAAGWSPGQLDSELDEGAWLVVPAHPTDLTSSEPSRLWETVLRRQGPRIAMMATMPEDPSWN